MALGSSRGRSGNSKVLLNERIKYDKVQLISADGTNEGVVSRDFALKSAKNSGLDLLIISEKGKEGYPVARIVDYGKMLYAKKKQIASTKKKQHVVQVKELKLRAKIGDHDLQTKLNRAIEFLRKGKRVKFTMMFRGREATMKDLYYKEIFGKVHGALEDDFGAEVAYERESRLGNAWSRVYFLKK